MVMGGEILPYISMGSLKKSSKEVEGLKMFPKEKFSKKWNTTLGAYLFLFDLVYIEHERLAFILLAFSKILLLCFCLPEEELYRLFCSFSWKHLNFYFLLSYRDRLIFMTAFNLLCFS